MIQIKKLLNKIEKRAEIVSDLVAIWSGKPLFLLLHIVWWGIWVGVPIEPFPYGLLTLIVSLEAICLSGLILSASNRAAELDRKMMRKEYGLNVETNEIVDRISDDIAKIRLILNSSSANFGR